MSRAHERRSELVRASWSKAQSSEMNSRQKSDQFRLLNHSCSSKDTEVILQPHSKLPFNLDINVKFSSVPSLLLLLSSSSSLDSSSFSSAHILQLLFFSSSSLAPYLQLLQCSHPAAPPIFFLDPPSFPFAPHVLTPSFSTIN